MTRRIVVVGVLLVACTSCLGTSHPRIVPTVAENLLESAKTQAKKEGKRVFLLFTAPDSEWCECYERYHADSEVSRIIQKHFALAKIDVKETPGGEQMYLVNGMVRGVPAFTLLDHDGMFLATSGDADNIGFPSDAEQIDRYFECLKAACPNLTAEETAVLRQKLEEIRPKEPADV
jgi:thioredoxin-related protein